MSDRLQETARSFSRLLIGGGLEEFARHSFTAAATVERAAWSDLTINFWLRSLLA
jgi:hypothetical protein